MSSEQWQSYVLLDKERVLAFLAEYPSVHQILSEAYTAIQKYLGDSKPSLQIVSDKEIENFDYLLIGVHTNLDVEEAWQRFSRFRDEWLLNNLERTEAKLTVDLEFE
jgi:hypothetical protein